MFNKEIYSLWGGATIKWWNKHHKRANLQNTKTRLNQRTIALDVPSKNKIPAIIIKPFFFLYFFSFGTLLNKYKI